MYLSASGRASTGIRPKGTELQVCIAEIADPEERKMIPKFVRKFSGQAALAGMLCMPIGLTAQTHYQYEHAKHVQQRHDARHHTKAKIVGGSAVGGAVVGGLMGGGKGAVIGAGVGAAGGLVANHARKQHDIHKRERREDERSY
jgi:uncharacterized protein YcfJ